MTDPGGDAAPQLHAIGGRRAWLIWVVALTVYVLAVFNRSSLGVAGLLQLPLLIKLDNNLAGHLRRQRGHHFQRGLRRRIGVAAMAFWWLS